jgi:hypothetical protein
MGMGRMSQAPSAGRRTATIIAGVDWVTQHATKPAVANLSLGGGGSFSVDNAVKGMIASGVGAAVAAGNSGANACNYSPARVGDALTIGATTSSDAKSSWSNYGSCLDWFAPGSSIQSAGITDDASTAMKSGTSKAAPHTAGVAALFLEANPSATPAQVRTALFDATTKSVVTSSSTTNNHLLYSRVAIVAEPEPNRPPTAGNVSVAVDAGATVSWSASVDDPDDDPLTCAIGSQPAKGTATLAGCQVGAGTYTAQAGSTGSDSFTYTVNDGDGGSATGTVSVTINTVAEPPAAISLAVRAYKVKGVQKADLTWSGTTSANVNIFRDGILVATTRDGGGAYTDNIERRGGGSYTYQVCEAGTTTCSNEVAVSY